MGLGNHGHGHGHGHSHDDGHNKQDIEAMSDCESSLSKLKSKKTANGHSHDVTNSNSNSHGHSHGHGHGHHHQPKKFCGCFVFTDKMRISSMLCMTFTFFLVELIAGQYTKSISLTTDAFHMLSDALALCIGLFSIIISKRKSVNNTFGWIRAEVLGPLINSVFLVSLCLTIVIEAVERLFEAREIKDPHLLLYVGAIGLSINIVGLFVFGHAHSHGAPQLIVDTDDESDESEDEEALVVDKSQKKVSKLKKTEAKDNKKKTTPKCQILSKEANMNMRAVFLHVLADALGSVIVIISALLNIYQSELHIPKIVIDYIDPVLCLCLVTLILTSTLPLLKESALILLQTVPKEIKIKQLKHDIVRKIPGILAVHELHVWKLSGSKIIATAHVTCHNSVEYMLIAQDLKSFFHKKGIHSTTIQPEFTDPIEGIAMENCLIECLEGCNPHTCCSQTNLTEENRNQLVSFNQQPLLKPTHETTTELKIITENK
jgi:zinc transporter 1